MKRYFLSCTTQKIGDGVKLGAKSFTDQGQITRSDGSPAVITRNLSFAETDRLADAIDSHPGFRGEKLEDAMNLNREVRRSQHTTLQARRRSSSTRQRNR